MLMTRSPTSNHRRALRRLCNATRAQIDVVDVLDSPLLQLALLHPLPFHLLSQADTFCPCYHGQPLPGLRDPPRMSLSLLAFSNPQDLADFAGRLYHPGVGRLFQPPVAF